MSGAGHSFHRCYNCGALDDTSHSQAGRPNVYRSRDVNVFYHDI